MKHYIGIDVSKRDFHACFSENGDIDKFDNTKMGIENFLNHLVKIGGKTIPCRSLRRNEKNGPCHSRRLVPRHAIHKFMISYALFA